MPHDATRHREDGPRDILGLHEFLESSARKHPDRIALEIPPAPGRPRVELSYREVDLASDRIANALREIAERDAIIAIEIPRSDPRLFLAQLGVLKSGAAYTCIDPSFPDAYAEFVLRDSAARALLVSGASPAGRSLPSLELIVLDIAKVLDDPAQEEAKPGIRRATDPTSLAYVIYTSGTTGHPKGVMIEHRSIVNLVRSDLETYGVTVDDRAAQGSSAAYDSSLEEVWLALAAGATVVVMDDATVRLGPDLVAWLRNERISILCPPPTLLRTMGCADPERELPGLRFVYVGGEALPRDLADRWARGRHLENGYGPTECTVTAVRGRIHEGRPVVIGRAVTGLTAYVIDGGCDLVADGEIGELCLAGAGLARGYLNQPELTAAKFPNHPRFNRIYRTGDLVRRNGNGDLECLGRIDAQVKLRGHRIELEAVEEALARCDGVLEAACRVEGKDGGQHLAAHIVARKPECPPAPSELRRAVAATLPAAMVPQRFLFLDRLPRTIGGKLDRKALPEIPAAIDLLAAALGPPRDDLDRTIGAAFRQQLVLPEEPGLDADFFDLGGNSLLAAQLISTLRRTAATASLAVRDVYEARTIRGLSKRIHDRAAPDATPRPHPPRPRKNPFVATAVQGLWLAASLVLASALIWFLVDEALPFIIGRAGLVGASLGAPLFCLAALLLYTPFSLAFAILVKQALIGRYVARSEPVFGSIYVRNWIVRQSLRFVPWRLLEGTVFFNAALRALGARIGQRVHIHRSVDLLRGGFDLLTIGDDATIGQEASLRLVELDDGMIAVGPVTIGAGAVVDTRAGVAAHAELGANSWLAPLSSLERGERIPEGELWDGVPALPAGRAPPRPSPRPSRFTPVTWSLALVLAKALLATLLAAPLAVIVIAWAGFAGIEGRSTQEFLRALGADPRALALIFLVPALALPLSLALSALTVRALGRSEPGVIGRWSLPYLRVWLKTGLLAAAGNWLAGALCWPAWLRLSGMRVGRKCEISTIIDAVPDLVEIGPGCFFADGIYLAGPVHQAGTVRLERTVVSRESFFGNHVVIPIGSRLAEHIFFGVATVATDRATRANTSWFGHPAFELPRREIVEFERRLTHDPGFAQKLTRWWWELARVLLPVGPLAAVAAWYLILARARESDSELAFHGLRLPLVTAAGAALLCALVLAFKWMLLGRVRPGQHGFWSSWCGRWDFLYVIWEFWAHRILSNLEGTLLLNWYLRAMGTSVGKRVVLGSGFAQLVDPDMLRIGDDVTVDAMFQAHSFEDRVLKIGPITIRDGATVGGGTVILYGADIGERSRVASHSVVMKHEYLSPARTYAGAPIRECHGAGVRA